MPDLAGLTGLDIAIELAGLCVLLGIRRSTITGLITGALGWSARTSNRAPRLPTVDPMLIIFRDDYVPDQQSTDGMPPALERGDPVQVRWPTRTDELLARKEAGPATILADIDERGGGPLGVRQYDAWHSDGRRFAAASERLPHLWRALARAGATANQAHLRIATFLRFAKPSPLMSIGHTELEGENIPSRTTSATTSCRTCSIRR
jgi:hypothetical protein